MTTKTPSAAPVTLPGLYNRYRVCVAFITQLEGGVPTQPEMVKTWMRARLSKAGRNVTDEELEKMVQETIGHLPEEVIENVTEDEVEKRGLWNTFLRDETGAPVMEARCVKSFFKEQANILKDLLGAEAKLQNRGSKKMKDGVTEKSQYNTMYRSKVAEQLFVEGIFLPFTRAGSKLVDVDGRGEKPIHVMTPRGQRHAVKRFDFINPGVQVEFVVRILREGVVTEHDLLRMLEHGQDNGLGSGRSQGNGRFRVVSVEELEPSESTPLFIKRRAERREKAA